MKAGGRLWWNSVRVRLTLWNVGILALGLAGMGAIFSLSIRANIGAAVDRRLSGRAHHMQWLVANAPPSIAAAVLAGRDPHPGPPPGVPQGAPAPDDRAQDGMRPRLFGLLGEPLAGAPAWSRAGMTGALRGQETFATVGGLRVLSVPLRRGGQIVAAAQWGSSLARFHEEESRTTRTLLTLIPAVLLIAGLGGAFLTDRALRPVRQIAQAAGRIEAENLSDRLPVQGGDEFAGLAETFNGMLARLQGAFERQEQAFEQQRRFTADASHELRTPLTIIKANTSLALGGERTAADLRKTVRAVDAAADRMTRIVQDLLLLARADAGQLTYPLVPVPVAEVLSQAIRGVQDTGEGPDPILHAPPALRVCGHADALERLFGNLLENAARHTPPDGSVSVWAEALGDVVRVRVEDTGEGIAPEHLPHVTERFYRGDAARSRARGGTGLGLSICRRIVEAHEGSLEIDSAPGRGTVVRVTLPRAEDALARPA